jgi:acetaldehyde dehydrogenase (acetylating)
MGALLREIAAALASGEAGEEGALSLTGQPTVPPVLFAMTSATRCQYAAVWGSVASRSARIARS